MTRSRGHRRTGRGAFVAAVGVLVLTGCVQSGAPATDTPADAGASTTDAEAADVEATGPPAASPPAADAPTTDAPTTDAPAPTDPSGPEPALAASLTFDPRLSVGSPGVGYLFEPEWLIPSWTLNHDGDEPVLVALGVPIGVPVEGVTPQSMVLEDQRHRTVWVTGTPEGRVRLSQQAFPVLEGVDGSDYSVAAAVLEPGSGLGGDGLALLPLQEAIPARDVFDVPGPGELPPDATEWEFCLQVAPVPEDLDPADPRITPQTEGSTLLCSDPEPLPEDWSTRPAPSAPPTRPPPD